MNLIAQNRFLEWLIGHDPNQAGSPRLQWMNLPESWGVFVLIAVIVAIAVGVFWLYRHEIKTCPMPLKVFLSVLRLSVLLLLIAMYLKPSVFFQQTSEIKPTIAILRDSSLSFDRGDRYRDEDDAKRLAAVTGFPSESIATGEAKRTALVNRAFEKNPQLLLDLRGKGSLQVIDFSDGTKSVSLIPAIYDKDSTRGKDEDADKTAAGATTVANDSGSPAATVGNETDNEENLSDTMSETLPPLVADGLGTDIWQVLKEVLDDPSRLSSIVLITDGQHNGSEDPLEMAKKAATLDTPIFVIGIGDPHPPKNLAVSEAYVRDRSYPDEPFEIEAILQSSQVGENGIPPEIDVRLIQQRVDSKTGELGAPEIVETKPVAVPPFGGRIRVDFSHVLNLPGSYVFTVAVDPIDDELDTKDNEKMTAQMEVVDEQVKVLLISGLPSWDYQQVQRLLQRDQSISLSCWLQSMDSSRPQEGDAPISRLPRTIAELGEYNIVILMDPNPEEFDQGWISLLKDFCKYKAGGVLFMAGPQYTSEFLTMNRLREIRDLLPIRFGDNDFIDSIQALADAKDATPGQMLLVNHNIDHPVMSFRSDPAETQKIWSQMPGIFWSFPTLAAKPTARVLLERGDQVNAEGNQPLMVAGRYGAGTVLYMGFQGTWKWRPVGLQAQFFDRFWIQVIRFLVETRSLQGTKRGFIDVEKSEFELGERITLIGQVLDPQFKPAIENEFEAIILSGDGRSQTVTMKKVPQQDGNYEGSLVAQRVGNFTATIKLGGDDPESKLIDPIAFRITPPSAESGTYWLNEKLLTEIATLSGGKYYRLDELTELTAAVPTLVTKAEFNSPPKPLWDMTPWLRWLAFGLPVALLTIEWAVRKWKKLL